MLVLGGRDGLKASRKGTPYAAQQTTLAAAGIARDQYGMKSVEVSVQGPGSGRESAVRAFAAAVAHRGDPDVTPIPHNGCRPPKRGQSLMRSVRLGREQSSGGLGRENRVGKTPRCSCHLCRREGQKLFLRTAVLHREVRD